MNQAQFESYLLFAALIAGLLGVVNLLRPHKRWLGAGAILLGFVAMLLRQGTSIWVMAIVGGLAVACMVKDAASRAGKPAKGREA